MVIEMPEAPEPRLARQIIEVLGQSGTPLGRGVSYYNVGNESILDALDKHYLSSYLADGGAVFKLVVGDYGSGKSHFLYCLRDLAWARNFVVSKVDLSPKECPYDDQKRVYGAVASAMIRHNSEGDDDDERGITRFIEGTLRRIVSPHGMNLYDEAVLSLPDIQALRQTLLTTPSDSLSYHKAIIGYVDALLGNGEVKLDALQRWLHGEESSPDDMKELRQIGVTEKITKNNAFKMLRSLCQMVRVFGCNGLALLFDEGDRMLSLSGKAEKAATDNLREVIDRCRDDLPGTLFVYAVPPDFIHNVIPKYPALQQRVQAPGYFSRSNPFSPQINLDHLDMADTDLLNQIGQKLLPIFEVAFGTSMNHEIQTQNIMVLAEASMKSFLAISHRRLFVKALVGEWFRQKEEGEQRLNSSDAQKIIQGEGDALTEYPDADNA
ncbi:MAG TPA: DUF2791 family P-loop domain-containing protein [Aggregatilineales bacterium]|nr:DUF2791 family P-loop domain-containing protein [Anaerolineales bacterium]HRE48534.1 DUF2791 family P-loop domain-containing protein [Aggregatilineales bacterium]